MVVKTFYQVAAMSVRWPFRCQPRADGKIGRADRPKAEIDKMREQALENNKNIKK